MSKFFKKLVKSQLAIPLFALLLVIVFNFVITSYSIHYTKLYEKMTVRHWEP